MGAMMRLDVSALLESLPSARWFGGKGLPLKDIEIIDFGVVEDGPPALVFSLVRVTFADDTPDHVYHLPLLVEDGNARDALAEPERLNVLGDLMAHGTSIKGRDGVFQFGGPGLDPLSPPGSESVRLMGTEQSNSSLVFDDQVILKLFRKVEPGINPDLELVWYLTNEAFPYIPLHAGDVIYEAERDGDDVLHIDLGLAQQFIGEAVEGWSKVLKHLHGFYDEADDRDAREDMRFLTEERAGAMLTSLEELGEVTAQLHVTLARAENDSELAPDVADSFDLDSWAARALALLRKLAAAQIPELKKLAVPISDRINTLSEVEEPGLKIRVHGDYHLGQVISTTRGWMILDFEGEPARTLDERREKQSALRDVAGMLRSFNYAAMAALFERTEPDTDEWKRLEPWAETWETLARERFLHGYLTRSLEGRFLPPDRETLMTMLDVFEIDKALYELMYEQLHRPDWVRIPIRGIAQVTEREPTR
jgi:trehalose synthase-fused probable maltokinase